MMTIEQKNRCHKIIHSHAAVAAAGNALPVPGGNIPENVAKNMAIAALKKTLLKQPIKTITKELAKLIPFAGQVVASSVSVAMLESAGWVMASELAEKAKK